MSTETIAKSNSVRVQLSDDKQKVVVTIENDEDRCVMHLLQGEALTLAGQIQAQALMIRKP